MKKRIFTFIILAALSIGAYATTYNYLTFTETSGTETSVSVSSLTITFSDGNMVATNSDGTTTIALTSLSKMYFSETATAIEHINAASETHPVTVYTVSGQMIGTFTDATTLKSNLKKGVYVIKSNGETSKILVK